MYRLSYADVTTGNLSARAAVYRRTHEPPDAWYDTKCGAECDAEYDSESFASFYAEFYTEFYAEFCAEP